MPKKPVHNLDISADAFLYIVALMIIFRISFSVDFKMNKLNVQKIPFTYSRTCKKCFLINELNTKGS